MLFNLFLPNGVPLLNIVNFDMRSTGWLICRQPIVGRWIYVDDSMIVGARIHHIECKLIPILAMHNFVEIHITHRVANRI